MAFNLASELKVLIYSAQKHKNFAYFYYQLHPTSNIKNLSVLDGGALDIKTLRVLCFGTKSILLKTYKKKELEVKII